MTPVLAPAVQDKAVSPKVLLFGALILLCYAPALVSLAGAWMQNEDMGHGFFVPVVASYIVWQRKAELLTLDYKPSWLGLPLVLLGCAQSLVATLGVELFLSRSAVIVTLAGLILSAGGTELLKRVGFPIFLLCFMVPLPALVFNSITSPLQLLASRLAEASLEFLSVPVIRQGNILELPSGSLSVVEACSGIRSLLSLSFLSLVYGHFFEKRPPVRVALFLATIPIAIVANAGRVTLTGLLAQVNPDWATGFFHESTGWVIFILALGLLLLFHRSMTFGIAMRGRRA